MAQTYSDKPTLEAWNALGGGAKIAYGTYIGDGTYGAEHPVTLTFDFEPKLLIVEPTDMGATFQTPSGDEFRIALLALRGVTEYRFRNVGITIKLAWNGNSVSWYEGSSERNMCNMANKSYTYLAIG